MGGSAKKVLKVAKVVSPLNPAVHVADKVVRDREKKKVKEERREADNAILTKEVESTNAAARAFEAEEKKKEKRQMGLGSAISGSESSLG